MSPRFLSVDKGLVVAYLMRSYPIIFSNLNVLAIEAINTIMVSRIGLSHAASAVLANTLFNIFKKINAGLSVSVALLVARADRKQNYKQVNQILKHGLLLNTLFAAIFIVLLTIISFYLGYASQSPVIATLAPPYLRIIAIALLPAALNHMIKRYLEGLSYGRIALRLNFLTLMTNLLFNTLLIYGRFGLPMLGLNGAGIAILCSEVITAIGGILYLKYILTKKKLIIPFNFAQISWRYFRKILLISWPLGLQFGIEGLYMLFIAIMAGWISIEAQAAHAILLNICQLITISAIGLGLSGSILVTQQGNLKNCCLVRKVAFMAVFMIGIVSIIVGIMLLTVSPKIIHLYKPVDKVRNLASSLIIHLSIFQSFYSICYWGNSILRGLKDNAFLCLANIITQCIGIIVCYILVVHYNWHLHGLWITLIFERMLLTIFLLIRFFDKTKLSG